MSARHRCGLYLLVFCISLSLSCVLLAQTQAPPAQTQKPAKPVANIPLFEPSRPHVNGPLGEIPAFPGDGNGAYKTGKYPDLFAEQGHLPVESRAKIEKAFKQLFHGDGQEERIYFETGANENGPLAYITDWANNDARTEGMSYGMMIAVQLDKKREFDAIWNWSKTYMLITDPKNPSVGYFAWSMNTDGTPRSANAASDGEEYYVMALYFAANRWGNGTGIYNYKAEADKILRGMRHHPVLKGTGPFRIHPDDPPFEWPKKPWPSPNNKNREREMAEKGIKPPAIPPSFFRLPRELTVGPMVDEEHFMIKFVPEINDREFTDPSYHLPAFYELWSRWGPEEDRTFWAKAADVSRDLFWKITGPETGLTPDTCNFDESPIIRQSGTPTPFGYDSWRSVANWSVDYAWWQKDQRQSELSNRIQKFLYSEGVSTFADRYTLDGKPLSTRHSTGMLATTTLGGFASTPGPISKAFVEELWNTPVPSGEQRYFDGMWYLMSMMYASGNFRIIEPQNK